MSFFYLCLSQVPLSTCVFSNNHLHCLVWRGIGPVGKVEAIVPGVKLLRTATKGTNDTELQNWAVGIEFLRDDKCDRDGCVGGTTTAIQVCGMGCEPLSRFSHHHWSWDWEEVKQCQCMIQITHTHTHTQELPQYITVDNVHTLMYLLCNINFSAQKKKQQNFFGT